MQRLWGWVGDPVFMRRFHGCAALFWLGMAPVSMLTGLRNSVTYLVGVSVYALIGTHWASWQAARVEVKEDEDRE